jgi:hypothetical protein
MTDNPERRIIPGQEPWLVEAIRMCADSTSIGDIRSVINTVEPMIRADERAKVSREEDMIYARAWDEVSNEVIAKVEAWERLPAKVEALNWFGVHDVGIVVMRQDVLDLLNGAGE